MHNRQLAKVKPGRTPGRPSPDAMLRAFGEVLQARKEYAVVVEQETTKRAAIAAALQARLEELQAFRDSFELYLEKECQMRRETIEGIFFRLDAAMAADKDEVAVQALRSLEGIVAHSPLGGALAAMARVLEKKGAVLEI